MKKVIFCIAICCITSLVLANPGELRKMEQRLAQESLKTIAMEKELEKQRSVENQVRGIVIYLRAQKTQNKPVIVPETSTEEVKPAPVAVKATVKAVEAIDAVYESR